jgi:hypothetical protein
VVEVQAVVETALVLAVLLIKAIQAVQLVMDLMVAQVKEIPIMLAAAVAVLEQ